ncbi:hypothetical protein BDZ94DRAFT_1263095 [Collybia nuda]|uniref:Uncharacterized protein n=1 Tax=Collybia nuda TaxID=64659 RepID=A0A9P5Y3P0_9AGAR|nr:hypothetical protein BDZ94DRAFT_1263095 [Collybia nuda]
MKTSASFFAVVASLMPTLTMGFVSAPWVIPNIPKNGLQDIIFPFSIADAPHKEGFYFRQQFAFNGRAEPAYTGLQPRPDDANGKPIINAALASFMPGTTSADSNCLPANDGRPGVRCSVDFSGPYDHVYNIEVRNTKGTTWNGTLVDAVTGQRVHVGSFTLPAGTGGIVGARDGFIEYFKWADGMTCAELPKTTIVFGTPKTMTHGAGAGSVGTAFDYGDCLGVSGFKEQKTALGTQVTVGLA